MRPLSKVEKQFKVVMQISAITYFVVGFAFALATNKILDVINAISKYIWKGFDTIPHTEGLFWVSLTFSMMMTITMLSYIVQRDVRRNNGYVIPLLVSKLASAVSGLAFFILVTPYFAYLAIFMVDGSIFWITLIFYLRSAKPWEAGE